MNLEEHKYNQKLSKDASTSGVLLKKIVNELFMLILTYTYYHEGLGDGIRLLYNTHYATTEGSNLVKVLIRLPEQPSTLEKCSYDSCIFHLSSLYNSHSHIIIVITYLQHMLSLSNPSSSNDKSFQHTVDSLLLSNNIMSVSQSPLNLQMCTYYILDDFSIPWVIITKDHINDK